MLFGASINNDTKCDCEGSDYNMNGMIMIANYDSFINV